MHGVLLIDKPAGLTSHDVVARLRRTSGERSIGHTGTLDPLATGLLPLVFGGATRLASYLTKGDKTYDATIRLGVATDTDDAEGQPLPGPAGPLPDDRAIDDALDAFRGTFDQLPPAHSAKKVGGERAYVRARKRLPVDLRPVSVTVTWLERLSRDGDRLMVRVSAAAGFYVRALARDLGERLGCGAHLAALRRTASGTFDVSGAITLAEAEAMGPGVDARLIAPVAALPGLPALELTDIGLKRVAHGNWVGPEHLRAQHTLPGGATTVRLLDSEGDLLAIAEARAGTLHPVVVLGYHRSFG